MKIYLFNLETGIYLGEDFADEAAMKQIGYIIPPDATAIEPPQTGHGQAPVFNSKDQKWEIRSCQHRDIKEISHAGNCSIINM
jgi:hypothetical protein